MEQAGSVWTTSGVVKENSVVSLKENPFSRRSIQEQKRIKELGPEQPDLQIHQQTRDRGRLYSRTFSRICYEKRSWLAGCGVLAMPFIAFPACYLKVPAPRRCGQRRG